MNAMSNALQSAGVKLPSQNERIWRWLKDHPNHSTKEIAVALNLSAVNVSSLTLVMYARGMLSRVSDLGWRQNGSHVKLYRYSTLGREFEILPMPKKAKAKETPNTALAPIVQIPTAKPVQVGLITKPEPVTASFMIASIEGMAFGEVRALYQHLKTIFG